MPAAPSLVQQIYDQAFNQGDLAVLDDLTSTRLIIHAPGWGVPASRLGFKQLIARLRKAFPDLHCSIDDELEQGDKFAARWSLRGTHRGAYFGSLPTGKAVDVEGFIFGRIERGRLVENWILIDQMSMLQQLGVIPPPRKRL